MKQFTQAQLASIGAYFITSFGIAVLLLKGFQDVPWWMAFPLATMFMIATGALQTPRPRVRRRRRSGGRTRRSTRR